MEPKRKVTTLTSEAIQERVKFEMHGKTVWVNGRKNGRAVEIPPCIFPSNYGQDDFNRDIAAALKVLAETVAE